ncbi:MAG: hypothetical protein ACHP9S_07475 [Terriglobales bacterium]
MAAFFKGVTVSGVPQVVELQFDAGKDSARWLSLQPWKDPETSGVVLLAGDKRIAPVALTMTGGGAMWQELTMVKDLRATRFGRGRWMSRLAGRPTVHLLFDVLADSAGKPMTLSVDLGLDGKPTPITVVMDQPAVAVASQKQEVRSAPVGLVAEQMTVLTDTSGKVLKLEHLATSYNEQGELQLLGVLYRSIQGQMALKLPSGAFQFVSLSDVAEYRLSGTTARLVLRAGQEISGTPVNGCNFTGEGVLGKVTVPASKTGSLIVKASEPPLAKGYSGSESYKSSAHLTLQNGDVLAVRNLAFVYRDHGPAVKDFPGTGRLYWVTHGAIPVEYGDAKGELVFEKLQALEFKPGGAENRADAAVPIEAEATMKSGEQLQVRLAATAADLRNYSGPVGLIANTDLGFVLAPFEALKSVEFAVSKAGQSQP